MPSARFLWNWVALISAIVAGVAASVATTDASDSTKMAVAATVAAPPLVVVALPIGFRLAVLLGLASVAYSAWMWIAGREELERAADSVFAAFELWPVVVAWCVAGVVALVVALKWVRDDAARRERDRQPDD